MARIALELALAQTVRRDTKYIFRWSGKCGCKMCRGFDNVVHSWGNWKFNGGPMQHNHEACALCSCTLEAAQTAQIECEHCGSKRYSTRSMSCLRCGAPM